MLHYSRSSVSGSTLLTTGCFHGACPETLRFAQSDSRRIQHDKKSVILSASEESHSF